MKNAMRETPKYSSIPTVEASNEHSNDQKAYRFAEYAYAQCVEWFGKPIDAHWPYHLYSHHRTMCVRLDLLRSYYILLKEETCYQWNCFNIGHEMYHRVTGKIGGLRQHLWIDEMVACMTGLELLRQSGDHQYAYTTEEQALDECPEILDVNVLMKFQLPFRRFEVLRRDTLYPPTYGADVVKIGSALKAVVGWDFLRQIIHEQSIEMWVKSLPSELQHATCLILDLPFHAETSMADITKSASIHKDDFAAECSSYDLGIAYYHKGNFWKAIAIFEEILQQDRDNIIVGQALSRALYRGGRITASLEALRRLVAIQPNNVNLRLSLAIRLHKCGLWDAASLECERVTQLDPKSATAYYYWGKALKCSGNIVEAKQKWREALGLDNSLIAYLAQKYL